MTDCNDSVPLDFRFAAKIGFLSLPNGGTLVPLVLSQRGDLVRFPPIPTIQ